VRQNRPGYGAALREGFAASLDAAYIVTMNADGAHAPSAIRGLWDARHRADVIVASRYVEGGASVASPVRHALSRVLNRVFSRALSVPVRDLSSGYRLYRRRVLDALPFENDGFAALPEILVRAYAEGYCVVEVPFQWTPPANGRALVRFARFASSYARTLWRLWQLRNSIVSADYDHRAHDSVIPLQRYWQRARHRIILDFTPRGGSILDVGCGSSRILRDLPGAVGVDVLLRKLRFLRPVHPQVLQASVFALPFGDGIFDTVICSEVIEHIPDEPAVLGELLRTLRPGGTLVLGTPDYGRPLWHVIEWLYGKVAPGGYADEHITHFDRRGLEARLTALGCTLVDCQYVGACEMIIKATKAT
jgi:SAM-dependent methyltransferase